LVDAGIVSISAFDCLYRSICKTIRCALSGMLKLYSHTHSNISGLWCCQWW